MSSRLTPRVTYVIGRGDMAKKHFDFAFKIYKDGDLKVILSDGTTPSGYSIHISQNTDGGYIQLAHALAVGTKITLYRDMAFVRQTQFRENRDFRASVMNEEFDRMMMMLQQVAQSGKDAIRMPLSDTQMDMALPVADLRANKVLAFDDKGRVQVRQDISDSVKLAEQHATDAKNAVVITDRNKRQVEQKMAILDLTPYAKKSDLGSASAKDTTYFVSSSDVGSGQNQVPKTDVDFKTKAVRAGVGGTLPIVIFIKTSGKFFVRNADGSLPSDIDSTKVWSLTDQKTAKGGTAPSSKTHIELPAGTVHVRMAGAGGSGGAYNQMNDGNAGGNTTVFGISAGGGTGGWAGTRRQPKPYNMRKGTANLGNNKGFVIDGGGGVGGSSVNSNGTHWGGGMVGQNGALVYTIQTLTAGQSYTLSVGLGGASVSSNPHYGNTEAGANGYIEVEYI